MKERRRTQRIRDKLVVICTLPGGETIEQEAVSEDISSTGIQIKTKQELSPEQIVGLRLGVLGDVIPFTMQGKVIWVKKIEEEEKGLFLAGIDFIEIDILQKERVSSYINRKLR